MKLWLVLVVAALGLAAACGGGDNGTASGSTTVDIEMTDIAFEPKTVRVGSGEEVVFRFTNKGKLEHEGYIGTPEEQAEHEKAMQESGEEGEGHGGHGGADDDRKVTVPPGETGELTHTFDEAGTYEIGCHEPGHYEAGMKVTVEVS